MWLHIRVSCNFLHFFSRSSCEHSTFHIFWLDWWVLQFRHITWMTFTALVRVSASFNHEKAFNLVNLISVKLVLVFYIVTFLWLLLKFVATRPQMHQKRADSNCSSIKIKNKKIENFFKSSKSSVDMLSIKAFKRHIASLRYKIGFWKACKHFNINRR